MTSYGNSPDIKGSSNNSQSKQRDSSSKLITTESNKKGGGPISKVSKKSSKSLRNSRTVSPSSSSGGMILQANLLPSHLGFTASKKSESSNKQSNLLQSSQRIPLSSSEAFVISSDTQSNKQLHRKPSAKAKLSKEKGQGGVREESVNSGGYFVPSSNQGGKEFSYIGIDGKTEGSSV